MALLFGSQMAPSIEFEPPTSAVLVGLFTAHRPGTISKDLSTGELLGLTALHILAIAMKLHFKVDGHMGSMHCDNERALGRAKLFRRRIPSGSKHGDLLRLLRNIKHTLCNVFEYQHIYDHTDRKKRWQHLTAFMLSPFCVFHKVLLLPTYLLSLRRN
jgi:hypothetical protein